MHLRIENTNFNDRDWKIESHLPSMFGETESFFGRNPATDRWHNAPSQLYLRIRLINIFIEALIEIYERCFLTSLRSG